MLNQQSSSTSFVACDYPRLGRVPQNGEDADAFWSRWLTFDRLEYAFVAALPTLPATSYAPTTGSGASSPPSQKAGQTAPVDSVPEQERETKLFNPTKAERTAFKNSVDEYVWSRSTTVPGQLSALYTLKRHAGFTWQIRYLGYRIALLNDSRRVFRQRRAARLRRHEDHQQWWFSVGQTAAYRKAHPFGELTHLWFQRRLWDLNDCFCSSNEADECWDEVEEIATTPTTYIPRRKREQPEMYGPYWLPRQEKVTPPRNPELLEKLRLRIKILRDLRKKGSNAKFGTSPPPPPPKPPGPPSYSHDFKLAERWLETASQALEEIGLYNEVFGKKRKSRTTCRPAVHQMDNDASGPDSSMSITQTSNVVITEQHGASAAAETPTGPAARLVSSDIINDYSELVKRELLYKTFVWANEPQNTEIFKAELPRDFVISIDGTPNSVPFKFNRYMRGDMHIRVQVNTNAFMIGSLQVAWYYQARCDTNFKFRNNIANNSQTLHTLVNAGTSNEAILVIPYKNFKPLVEIGQRADKDVSLYLGFLSIRVLNKLMCTSTVENSASVSIYISFDNTEFTGYVNSSLNNIVVPTNVAHQMETAAALGALTIAERMLDANRDKPTSSAHPTYYSPQVAQSWCHGTGLSEDTFDLRLQRADVPHPTRYTDAPFNQSDVIQRFGYCRTEEWPSNKPSGFLLTSFEAAPMVDETWYYHQFGANEVPIYTLPPVAFIANMYQYWRGSLQLRLDFIATAFHNGRLLIAYIPGEFNKTVTIEQAKASTYVVFDLAETQQCLFSVPFISDKQYWPRRMQVDGNGFDSYSPGYVYVFVLNKLVAMDTIPNVVPFNVYMAGGPDMEFIIPAQPTIGLSWNTSWIEPKGAGAAISNSSNFYVGTYTDFSINFPSQDFFVAVLRYGPLYGHLCQIWMSKKYDWDKGECYYLKAKDWKIKVRSTPSGQPDTMCDVFLPYYDGNFVYCLPCRDVSNAEWWCRALIQYRGDVSKFATATVCKNTFFNYPKGDDGDPYYSYTQFDLVLVKKAYENDFVLVDHQMDPRVDADVPVLAGTSLSVTTGYGRSQLGESFGDFKDVCRRYQPYCTVIIPSTVDLDAKPSRVLFEFPVLPQGLDLDIGTQDHPKYFWNKLREGFIPLLLSGYRFFRGSIRFRVSLPDFPGTYFVQHIPFVSLGKRRVVIKDREFSSASDVFNHGYAYTIQSKTVNSVLSFEVPFYLNVDSMLLQCSAVNPKNVNTDIAYACSLGVVRIGVAHVDANIQKKDVHFEVVYSLGDDARPSVFQGFPPVIFTQQVPSDISHFTASANHQMMKSMFGVKDQDVENAKAVVGQLSSLNLKEVEATTVQTLESICNSSSAIEKVCEKVEKFGDNASQGFESFLENLKSSSCPIILISALGHIAQVIYNPQPMVMGIAIASFLLTLGAIAFDKVQVVAKYICNIMNVFQKEQPNDTKTATAQMDNQDAAAVASVLFAGMSTAFNTKAKCTGPYAKSLGESLMSGLTSGARDGSYFFRFLSNIMQTLVKIYDYIIKKIFPQKLGLETLAEDVDLIELWVSQCIILTSPENESLFDICPPMANRVHSCYILGSIFIARLSTLPRSVNTTIIKDIYNKIIQLRTVLYDKGLGGNLRREPYILWMGGAPGIGKSHVAGTVIMKMLEAGGIHVTGNPIYTHPAGAKYWENCRQEPAILMDDAFVTRSGETNEAEIATFMSLKSCALFTPPMAECDRKKKLYAPEICYVNSNNNWPELNNMETKEAIYRRRDSMWIADLAMPYNSIKEVPRHILASYGHLRFYRIANPSVPESPNTGIGYTYNEFVNIVCDEFTMFRNNQISAYQHKMKSMEPQFAAILSDPTLAHDPLSDVILKYSNEERFADIKAFLPESRSLAKDVREGVRHVLGQPSTKPVATAQMSPADAINKLHSNLRNLKCGKLETYCYQSLIGHIPQVAHLLTEEVLPEIIALVDISIPTYDDYYKIFSKYVREARDMVFWFSLGLDNELYSFLYKALDGVEGVCMDVANVQTTMATIVSMGKFSVDEFKANVCYRFTTVFITDLDSERERKELPLSELMFVCFPNQYKLDIVKILNKSMDDFAISEVEPVTPVASSSVSVSTSTPSGPHCCGAPLIPVTVTADDVLKRFTEDAADAITPLPVIGKRWKKEELRTYLEKTAAPKHICLNHAQYYFDRLSIKDEQAGRALLNVVQLHGITTPELFKDTIDKLIKAGKICRHFFTFDKLHCKNSCHCINLQEEAEGFWHFCRGSNGTFKCLGNCIAHNEPLLDEPCENDCVCRSRKLYNGVRALYIKNHPDILLESIKYPDLMPRIFQISCYRHVYNSVKSKVWEIFSNIKKWIWEKLAKLKTMALTAFEFVKKHKWVFSGVFLFLGGACAFIFRDNIKAGASVVKDSAKRYGEWTCEKADLAKAKFTGLFKKRDPDSQIFSSERTLNKELKGTGELLVKNSVKHEMVSSGDARVANKSTRIAMKARGISNLAKFGINPQHQMDMQAEVVYKKLLNNTVILVGMTKECKDGPADDQTLGVIRALFIGGRYAVTVMHAFQVFTSRQAKYVGFYLKDRFISCTLDSCCVVPLDNSSLCVVKFPASVPEFKNIVNWIASETDHAVRGPSEATLVKIDYKYVEVVVPVSLYTETLNIGGLEGAESITNTNLYQYPAQGAGVCGSLLICGERSAPIYGMHIAGDSSTCIGFSEPLFRETFALLFAGLKEPEVACSVEEILMNADDAKIDIPTAVMPVGSVINRLAHSSATKSAICQSAIHGFVPITTTPAPLHIRDLQAEARRQGVTLPAMASPLVEGCNKHGVLTTDFPRDLLQRTYERLRTEILVHAKPVRSVFTPVLTDQQAVCGDHNLPYCDALNWNSSEGYPYFAFRPAGVTTKKWLFKLDERGPQTKLVGFHPLLEENLKLRRGLRSQNKKFPTIFTDCLKDAKIPIEKYFKPGKTRIFSMSPVDYTIDFRKYIYDFIAAFQTHRFKCGNMIGINVFSEEWNVLATSLLRHKNICTGDYSNFGPGLNEEVADWCTKIILDWYDMYWPEDSEENQNTRRCLLAELIGALHLCKDLVYQVRAGIPSGSPITVGLNSLVNLFYIYAAWDLLSQDWPLHLVNFQNFREHVVLYTYGDDFIMSVSETYKDIFNSKTISDCLAKFNIIMTDAQKGEEVTPYTTLENSTFLKGKFNFFDNRWWYGLQISQIYDMCNWVRISADLNQATIENVDAALIHAQGHGRDFFNLFKTQVKGACIRNAVPFHGRTYDQIYKIKTNVLVPDPMYINFVRKLVALV